MHQPLYFVAGIDTNVGKTLVSAILVESLGADYWKPIQTGAVEGRDTTTVQQWVSPLTGRVFYPEAYCLPYPASPHTAAEREGITIEVARLGLPEGGGAHRALVIEGAGGLMVPLNDQYLLIDWIKTLPCAVVLVVRNYLGSINHTLLSVAALQHSGIPIKGFVFNGEPNPSGESYILRHTGLPCLLRLPWQDDPAALVQQYKTPLDGFK